MENNVLYRYMIGDTECGGCVLAPNEQEAAIKLHRHYGAGKKITVWIDDDVSVDIVEVYP